MTYEADYPLRGPIGTLANSVDPDQTPQNAASDQDLQFALNTGISFKHGNNKN